jgi:hypothetical protein
VKWNFVKIWSRHVQNHHNSHSYNVDKFHDSYQNSLVDDGKIYNFKTEKTNSFFEKKNCPFCQCGN